MPSFYIFFFLGGSYYIAGSHEYISLTYQTSILNIMLPDQEYITKLYLCIYSNIYLCIYGFFTCRSFYGPQKWKLNEAVGRFQYLFL